MGKEPPIIPSSTVLAGKYVVEAEIGRGGMAVVLSAWHKGLDQRVAIKLLLPEHRTNPQIAPRFVREAKAAARIRGVHVARVMDVDQLTDGTPFLVMEHLEGTDLSVVRRNGKPLASHVAATYVAQACVAINEAHTAGVIHRDIKPGNLFLARMPDGSHVIKVLDFGISKMAGPPSTEDGSSTQSAVLMGSVRYMAPEQITAPKAIDYRVDIWALGAVLYELCTAAPPFGGDNLLETSGLVLSTDPAPPRGLAPDLPKGLEEIILRCLTRDRERRFGSADALAKALEPFTRPRRSDGGTGTVTLTEADLLTLTAPFPLNPATGTATGKTGGTAGPMSRTRAPDPTTVSPARLTALILGAALVGSIGTGIAIQRGVVTRSGAPLTSTGGGASLQIAPPLPSAAATAGASAGSPSAAPVSPTSAAPGQSASVSAAAPAAPLSVTAPDAGSPPPPPVAAHRWPPGRLAPSPTAPAAAATTSTPTTVSPPPTATATPTSTYVY